MKIVTQRVWKLKLIVDMVISKMSVKYKYQFQLSAWSTQLAKQENNKHNTITHFLKLHRSTEYKF